MASNPRSTIVGVSLGDGSDAVWVNSVPPSTLLGMTHTRYIGEQGNEFNATFVDTTAYDLETRLMTMSTQNGYKIINYQYGYSFNVGKISPIFSGIVYDYKPSISGRVVKLEIQAVSKESTSVTNTATSTYGVSGSVIISDIVKQLAYENDWILGTIETTAPITKTFTRHYTSPMEFINNQLVPYAVSSSTGNGNYSLYFTNTITGKLQVNFKSLTVETPAKSYTMINGVSADYTFNNPESTILSWNPNIIGSALLYGGGSVESNTMLDKTGDVYRSDSVNNLTSYSYSGNRKWLLNNQYATMSISSNDRTATDSAVSAAYTTALNYQYETSCTILGDPTRVFGETLEFNIVTQGNKLHYSSGKYLVIGVTDNITASGYTTELNLVKNASLGGSNSTTTLSSEVYVDTTNPVTSSRSRVVTRTSGITYEIRDGNVSQYLSSTTLAKLRALRGGGPLDFTDVAYGGVVHTGGR
jgi:hypothetical protein